MAKNEMYRASACVFKRKVLALRVSPFPVRIFYQLAAKYQ